MCIRTCLGSSSFAESEAFLPVHKWEIIWTELAIYIQHEITWLNIDNVSVVEIWTVYSRCLYRLCSEQSTSDREVTQCNGRKETNLDKSSILKLYWFWPKEAIPKHKYCFHILIICVTYLILNHLTKFCWLTSGWLYIRAHWVIKIQLYCIWI